MSQNDIEAIVTFLKQSSLFGNGIDPYALEATEATESPIRLEEGAFELIAVAGSIIAEADLRSQPFCEQGDPLPGIYAVMEGSVSLKISAFRTQDTSAGEWNHRQLLTGDYFGEIECSCSSQLAMPAIASAWSKPATKLFFIPHSNLWELFENPTYGMRIMERFMSNVSRRYYARLLEIAELRKLDAGQRLRKLLLRLGHNRQTIDATNAELGDMAEIAPSKVSAMLNQMANKEITITGQGRNRKIVLEDEQALGVQALPGLNAKWSGIAVEPETPKKD